MPKPLNVVVLSGADYAELSHKLEVAEIIKRDHAVLMQDLQEERRRFEWLASKCDLTSVKFDRSPNRTWEQDMSDLRSFVDSQIRKRQEMGVY